MYAHDEARVMFLAQPRTASTAVSQALVEQAGFVGTDRGKHATPESPVGDGWLVIATHRNPFDYLASWWYFQNRPCPFGREFLEWLWYAYPPFFGDGFRDTLFEMVRPHVTRWLRYSTIEADVNDAISSRGLDAVSLDRICDKHDRRNGAPYQAIYTQDFRAYVRRRFEGDFRDFGYEWENVWGS